MKNRLRHFRKAAGLSVEEVAARANLAPSTVTRTENRRMPSKGVRAICAALGIAPEAAFLMDDQFRLVQAFDQIPEKHRRTALETLLLMCERWQDDAAA